MRILSLDLDNADRVAKEGASTVNMNLEYAGTHKKELSERNMEPSAPHVRQTRPKSKNTKL